MDRQRVRELTIDRLCGELGEEDARSLETLIADNPELLKEMRFLERVWHKLGLLDVEPPCRLQAWAEILRKDRERIDPEISLNEQELELAAGGIERQRRDPDPEILD